MLLLDLRFFGGRGASSTSKSGGNKKNSGGGHPMVTSLDGLIKGPINDSSRAQWVQNTIGGSSSDAAETAKAANKYSEDWYSEMHRETGHMDAVSRVNALIDNPKTPVYNGETYRGISLTRADESSLVKQLNSGRWKEPGITSFSTSESTARNFANANYSSQGISVIIHNTTHTKGMPFKHLSSYPHENEVLQSSSTMKKGMRVLGYTTTKKGNRTIYNVDVADN